MRTKEQFKSYVYEKAAMKKQSAVRSRKIWIRSVVTCSVLVVVFGVMLHGRLDNVAYDMAPEAENVSYAEVYKAKSEEKASASGSGIMYSMLADSVDDGAMIEAEECESVLTFAANDANATDGFKNATPVKKDEFDAFELAKRECTVTYDSYTVEYESDTELWKVTFYTSGIAGGDQTVYIDRDGITVAIVYGE